MNDGVRRNDLDDFAALPDGVFDKDPDVIRGQNHPGILLGQVRELAVTARRRESCVAVAPALSPPSPVKPRSARTKHSCELACITPLEQRMWCASARFVGLKT
jgi:hypothetical protein